MCLTVIYTQGSKIKYMLYYIHFVYASITRMRERLERKDTLEEKTEVSRWRLLSFSLNKGCSHF